MCRVVYVTVHEVAETMMMPVMMSVVLLRVMPVMLPRMYVVMPARVSVTVHGVAEVMLMPVMVSVVLRRMMTRLRMHGVAEMVMVAVVLRMMMTVLRMYEVMCKVGEKTVQWMGVMVCKVMVMLMYEVTVA
jgi:hypothetical protein